MKPRFSILTLLGVTAYVGLSIAAIRDPLSIWSSISFLAWFGVVTFIGIYALIEKGPRAAYFGGMFVTILAYSVAASVEANVGENDWGSRLIDQIAMPHNWLHEYIGNTKDPEFMLSRKDVLDHLTYRVARRWSVTQCSLVFGMIGGCLAFWRYRVLERREKEQSHSND
jgi:hypothetical protein